MQASARKFGARIVDTRAFAVDQRSAPPRGDQRRAADGGTERLRRRLRRRRRGRFGRIHPLPHRPAPALPSARRGWRPVAWHPFYERNGAPQLNRRFERAAGRPMSEEAFGRLGRRCATVVEATAVRRARGLGGAARQASDAAGPHARTLQGFPRLVPAVGPHAAPGGAAGHRTTPSSSSRRSRVSCTRPTCWTRWACCRTRRPAGRALDRRRHGCDARRHWRVILHVPFRAPGDQRRRAVEELRQGEGAGRRLVRSRARRVHRPARPQRRGQEHAVPDPDRPFRGRRGRGARGGRRHRPRTLRRAGANSASCSSSPRSISTSASSRTCAITAACTASRGRARRDAIDEALALFGQEDVRGERARKLSGGNRRKIELARSLMTEPSSCSSTRPRRGSTPRAAAISSTTSRASRVSAGWPCCGPRTSSRRSWTPTASSCSTAADMLADGPPAAIARHGRRAGSGASLPRPDAPSRHARDRHEP